ncbi:hypothetical protein [Geminocystis herdmanii]|uniref:hypothetical protein n=1 Tax=Geminocystis herdmanii TaxID=669359 RepID=UPI00034CFF54|nr:hypothetical protein [Geminocystis herdmanii]
MYSIISGSQKLNSEEVLKKYHYKCFKCGKDLHNVNSEQERPLDHPLPIYYLYPLTTETATLLCRNCNGKKRAKWPSAFYSEDKVRELSIRTGISYELLSGEPLYNSDALEYLKKSENVDQLLKQYAKYMNVIIKLRNRILKDCGFDFFKYSQTISQDWIEKADKEYE